MPLKLLFLIIFAIGALAASNMAQACRGSKDNTNAYVCYSVNIPDETTTSQSSTGNIYVQILGNAGFTWLGFGIGQGMTGATMFIIYADGNGNVTLSTRKGSGHFMPTLSRDIRTELLAGSQATAVNLTANILCENCPVSPSSWIWAGLYGGGLIESATSPNALIKQHSEDYGTFSLDLTKARGGANSNPFLNDQESSPSSSPSPSPDSRPTSPSSTPSPSPDSRPTSAPSASKGLSSGAIAGIVVGVIVPLLVGIGVLLFLKKRRINRINTTTEEASNEWEKPEIDGRAVPFVELSAERDATELPIKSTAVIEMPGDTNYITRQANQYSGGIGADAQVSTGR